MTKIHPVLHPRNHQSQAKLGQDSLQSHRGRLMNILQRLFIHGANSHSAFSPSLIMHFDISKAPLLREAPSCLPSWHSGRPPRRLAGCDDLDCESGSDAATAEFFKVQSATMMTTPRARLPACQAPSWSRSNSIWAGCRPPYRHPHLQGHSRQICVVVTSPKVNLTRAKSVSFNQKQGHDNRDSLLHRIAGPKGLKRF